MTCALLAGQASDRRRADAAARGSARFVLREAGRLEPLFRASPTAALREAGPITRESDRLFVGPARRTIGVPTAALAYLHPDNRDAFAFKSKGRASVQGQEAVEITFEEVGRPTLNRNGAGGDVPVNGAFFVRETDGAILRSRTELAFDVKDAPRGRLHRDHRVPRRPRNGVSGAGRDERESRVAHRACTDPPDRSARRAVPGRPARRTSRRDRARRRQHRRPGGVLGLPLPGAGCRTLIEDGTASRPPRRRRRRLLGQHVRSRRDARAAGSFERAARTMPRPRSSLASAASGVTHSDTEAGSSPDDPAEER